VIKDLYPRYQTMCGRHVPRKAGWDTHGLPVEIEVEKELGISGKDQIEKYGVEAFVRRCMDSVFRYTADWERLTERIGFWIDLPDAYVTYHRSYVESVWWSLQQLHRGGLLCRGHKVLPYCPRCGTALSSHEVGQGYKQVTDPSVYVAFQSVEDPQTAFLAWTTTPWTLPCNAGLAIKADTEYARVKVGDEHLIFAAALVETVMGKVPHEIVERLPGSALVGRRYRPLFDWAKLSEKEAAGAWKVCAADFVDLSTGTGIVHVAPAYGADDYNLGRKEELPVIHLVDPKGCFTADCKEFAGRFVKDADADLIRRLKENGRLLKRENYVHDYPFCWRCDSPLIYYARGGWFIQTTREVKTICADNQRIRWLPEHIRDGRFGNFLSNNVDWALSRERFWGTPLNVWCCEKSECGREEAVGSLNELKAKPDAQGFEAFEEAKRKDPTLNAHLCVHKPWIDAVTFACPSCGGRMRRVSEVVDCWYDSGAMPFAQWGYPHAPGAVEKFQAAFPADFISEAIDQTRGWFYSLLAESVLLARVGESADADPTTAPFVAARKAGLAHPFKACVVLGHVCDEKGDKMSKHVGNYLDPNEILDKEGADALRWFFYSSTNPWTSARFSRGAVREGQKEFLLKLRNVHSFFVIYANLDGFNPKVWAPRHLFLKPGEAGVGRNGSSVGYPALDRWILAELHATLGDVRKLLELNDSFAAAAHLNGFVEALSNWYVRRSRERFWRSWETPEHSSAADKEKAAGYATLYEVLTTTALMTAPFTPFFAERLWQNLVREPLGTAAPESVHLCAYPSADATAADAALAAETAEVRAAASLGRAARTTAKIRTRQPLARVVVVASDAARVERLRRQEETLKEELNVKAIEYAADADQYVDFALKPNFKEIGAKFRALVPAIKQALEKADAAKLKAELDACGKVTLPLAGAPPAELTSAEVEVRLAAKAGFAAAGEGGLVVVLDVRLTEDLRAEGLAREVVNRVNGWRGELNLRYEQRVALALRTTAKIAAAVGKFEDYIRRETLAVEILRGDLPAWPKASRSTFEVDGEPVEALLDLR
jgi:isoleucyl-tRNA synthetase